MNIIQKHYIAVLSITIWVHKDFNSVIRNDSLQL